MVNPARSAISCSIFPRFLSRTISATVILGPRFWSFGAEPTHVTRTVRSSRERMEIRIPMRFARS